MLYRVIELTHKQAVTLVKSTTFNQEKALIVHEATQVKDKSYSCINTKERETEAKCEEATAFVGILASNIKPEEKNMQYNSDYRSILSKSPMELLLWLQEEFAIELPEMVVSEEDMKKASKTMLHLSNSYSYLMTLLSYAKVMTREAKRSLSKEEHEDMVDRKDVLQNFTEIIKQSYAAVSRAVTINIENNNELRMGRGTP